jgi:hypothetical protein
MTRRHQPRDCPEQPRHTTALSKGGEIMDFVLELQIIEADEESVPTLAHQESQIASLIPLLFAWALR